MKNLSDLLELRLVAACTLPTGVSNLCTSGAIEHFAAGGGRVRANICLDAAIQQGLSEGDAVCLASVCELLHNASLIQDDLLDRTTVRRGAPSIWVRHGDTVAVCTGDLMLSAAYSLLAELSVPAWIGPAIRLVHRRTGEVILGQAAEGSPKPPKSTTAAHYEQLARAKSASLLSLSLELPLLLSGEERFLEIAHSVTSDFAVAYQIADDLADTAQDMLEGSPNLVLLLIERDGLTRPEAYKCATELATERLSSAERLARLLPNNCAATLLLYADRLRNALADHTIAPLATAGA